MTPLTPSIIFHFARDKMLKWYYIGIHLPHKLRNHIPQTKLSMKSKEDDFNE